MDAAPSRTPPLVPAEIARLLADQGERLQDFLVAQRERIVRVEIALEERIRLFQSQLQRRYEELQARYAQLAAAEAGLEAKHTSAAVSADKELQCRLQMAMDDIRQLRARNAELESQVARGPARVPYPARPLAASGPLDWESQKRRVLADLETLDPGQPDQAAERLQVQEVVRMTEEALRDKDRELDEMRLVLKQQSSNLGGLAVGAAALGEILDQDALIRDERENLQRLQQQWEQTLRQAEIEISLERAKLARERMEIDDKLRACPPAPSAEEARAAASRGEKPVRGRWLARLGLKDADG